VVAVVQPDVRDVTAADTGEQDFRIDRLDDVIDSTPITQHRLGDSGQVGAG
jgi:hypothetical protein